MNLEEFQEWVLILSGSITMLSVAVGIWLSLREYRLKLQAERRQERSSEIEAEIRLQTLFTELMGIANGRSGYQISEKAVEYLLATPRSDSEKIDIRALHKHLQDFAILTLPVGSASQDAAVAAIASLTMKYPILREAGLCALESLLHPVTSPVTEHYHKAVKKFLAEEDDGEGNVTNS